MAMHLVLHNNTQEHTPSMMVVHNRVSPSDIVALLASINMLSDVPEMTTMD